MTTKFNQLPLTVCIVLMCFMNSSQAQYFAQPQQLGISSSVHFTPSLSADELEFFYTNWVANGHWDIFTASRDDATDEWNAPYRLDEIDTSSREDGVAISANGLAMIYGSQRNDGQGGFDLWTITRPDRAGDWSDPVNVSAINTTLDESSPSLSADGRTLYFSAGDWDVRGTSDIWYSTRSDINAQEWSIPQSLPNVNSKYTDEYPSISSDGLHLYFMSDRPGGFGSDDIYVASRNSRSDDFGTPMNLGPVVNTQNVDYSPFISTTGDLYYTRDVIPGQPGWEVWIAEPRAPLLGDLDGDETLGIEDLNLLSESIRRRRQNVLGFDLDGSGEIDPGDIQHLVIERMGTWIGDANLDGEFNSSDLTLVFQAAEYEDGRRRNSTWSEGDWNGDLEFDSSDLVSAFQDAGYERGVKNVLNVPEVHGIRLLFVIVIPLFRACGVRSELQNIRANCATRSISVITN